MRKEPVISIVDDDQFVRDSLKRLMKSFGYMATAQPTAGDFLNSPQREETSCLIADVNMPGMTGVAVVAPPLRATNGPADPEAQRPKKSRVALSKLRARLFRRGNGCELPNNRPGLGSQPAGPDRGV